MCITVTTECSGLAVLVVSFELQPTAGHTRLISRNRFDTALLPLRDKLAYPVIEPGSCCCTVELV